MQKHRKNGLKVSALVLAVAMMASSLAQPVFALSPTVDEAHPWMSLKRH